MTDLIFGSNTRWRQRDSLGDTIEELESRGREVKRISASDLDPEENQIANTDVEKLNNVPLLYRRNYGFNGDQVLEDLRDLRRTEYGDTGFEISLPGPDIFPDWNGIRGSDNKRIGKEQFEDHKVPFVPSYDAETARAVHSAGHPLIEKPEEGSQGDGVRPVMPDEDFVFNPNRIYEPLINHHDPESPWVERRAVGFAGKTARGVFAVKDRVLKDRESENDFRPKNISNGNGRYRELDPITSPFMQQDASFVLDAIDATGGGVQGVDYLYNRKNGQRMVIETNANVGLKGIRKASDADIDSYGADILEKEIEGDFFHGMTENLEQYSPHQTDFNSDEDEDLDTYGMIEELGWTPEYLSRKNGKRNTWEITAETEYSANTADSAA